MFALLMAWKTLQVLFLPKDVTLLGLVSAVWLTVANPNLPPQDELEQLIPTGELENEDPAQMNDCFRKLWATYQFRLARYRLDHGTIPYVTATLRQDGEIFFVFLNDREDYQKLRTKKAIGKLWLGAFSVDPDTGECSTYESIHGKKKPILSHLFASEDSDHPKQAILANRLGVFWVGLLERIQSTPKQTL